MTAADDSSAPLSIDEPVKILVDSIARDLDREREHRDKLELRAGTIVTTTGGLVTATGAVIAFSPRPSAGIPTAALVAIVASLILFLVSILSAQLSNLPRHEARMSEGERTRKLEIESLIAWTRAQGNGGADSFMIAPFVEEDTLSALQLRANNRRTMLTIRIASIAQMFAITALTFAALALVLAGPWGS